VKEGLAARVRFEAGLGWTDHLRCHGGGAGYLGQKSLSRLLCCSINPFPSIGRPAEAGFRFQDAGAPFMTGAFQSQGLGQGGDVHVPAPWNQRRAHRLDRLVRQRRQATAPRRPVLGRGRCSVRLSCWGVCSRRSAIAGSSTSIELCPKNSASWLLRFFMKAKSRKVSAPPLRAFSGRPPAPDRSCFGGSGGGELRIEADRRVACSLFAQSATRLWSQAAWKNGTATCRDGTRLEFLVNAERFQLPFSASRFRNRIHQMFHCPVFMGARLLR